MIDNKVRLFKKDDTVDFAYPDKQENEGPRQSQTPQNELIQEPVVKILEEKQPTSELATEESPEVGLNPELQQEGEAGVAAVDDKLQKGQEVLDELTQMSQQMEDMTTKLKKQEEKLIEEEKIALEQEISEDKMVDSEELGDAGDAGELSDAPCENTKEPAVVVEKQESEGDKIAEEEVSQASQETQDDQVST